ncbi:unnamed protein product [Heterobilharzia americana]|nr:unnamed protein product [Heterobilharzia americana]
MTLLFRRNEGRRSGYVLNSNQLINVDEMITHETEGVDYNYGYILMLFKRQAEEIAIGIM